ncbi:DNA cytosine methyltransferase [Fictibacillus nanhaiensis]|uniref:DNA cytosine methyltransferase n=1 Tax=Fictibacillus nanhaiensis TaxID=742169 RepID=UPI003C1B44EC
MSFTSIDLFSGPGGLCTGFKWAKIKPLIAVEMSDWTVKTYASTHNAVILNLNEFLNGNINEKEFFQFDPEKRTVVIHGDITKVENNIISKLLQSRFNTKTVDIVTGGAPCESFSMAGHRKEDDERNNLFLNILRIARHVDSKMLLFENVKGLFSKSVNGVPGQMYKDICDEFERIDPVTGVGFKLASREKSNVLLKASDYGVPQNRERIFLVGINTKYNGNYEYPQPTHGPNCSFPYVSVGDAILDLPQLDSGEETSNYIEDRITSIQTETTSGKDFIRKMRGELLEVPNHLSFNINEITSHKAVNHRKVMLKRMELIRQGENMRTTAERLIMEGKEDLRNAYFPKKLYGARNRRLVETLPSFTVTSHCLDEMIHPNSDRGLTPREAARLQSFPDWYIFEGPYVKFHSDPEQDRYEQIGDAIPPLLAYALGIQVEVTLRDIKEHKTLVNTIEV